MDEVRFIHFIFYRFIDPVVADVTHDPSETPVVLETPVVDDDYFHAKKKPCLDDRDENPPLDRDRETTPGLEEQSSRPGG